MRCTPKEALKQYELFVFNYSPKLKIVGTYHSLNEQDKIDLDQLISESDFIALEYDSERITKMHSPLVIDLVQRAYRNDRGEVVMGPLDALFLAIFVRHNEANINRSNHRLKGQKEVRVRSSEFSFCYDVAQEQGKTTYLVDLPVSELELRLACLPLKTKIESLWRIATKNTDLPEMDRVIIKDREDYMLTEIEKKEGCSLRNLQRNGIMVVGMTHAINYYRSLQSTKTL